MLYVHIYLCSSNWHRNTRSSAMQKSWFSVAILRDLLYYGDLT